MLIAGVDVGGTFTDLVLFDVGTGEIRVSKVPSTPDDPTEGIGRCLQEGKLDLIRLKRFIHGTTVATNAVVERKGAKTALMTTKGFRDIIEICNDRRYTGGLLNPKWVRMKPFVPRPLRFEVDERVSYRGEVLTELKDREIVALIERFKELKIESVAVCFLHSYTNRSHEERVGELLERNLPNVPYSLSAATVPEYRELERFMTTVLNAYIAPLLKEYLEKLDKNLRRNGYKFGPFYMTSSGGVVTEKTAAAYPVKFILSGPAAAVIAGVFLGKTLDMGNLITYDMGGTSTDVCLVKDLKPLITTNRVFLAYPIKTSQIDINTIGAGGGSIAWVDATGALRVGPQSAGAVPGPMSYGLGGIEPTVTDANLLLGRLGPTTLLGGTMTLNRQVAEKGIKPLAQRVGIPDIYEFAEGILKIAITNMCGAIREISIERGHDPRDFVLVSMGGAGPLHAIPIAEELGIPKIIVPNYPGNFSAFGLVVADLKHDYVKTYLTRLREADLSRIRSFLNEMAEEGCRDLLSEGLTKERISVSYSADMRYLGQAFELNVPVTLGMEIPHLETAFHEVYHKAYGYAREGADVELVNLRVVATGHVDKPLFSPISKEGRRLTDAIKEKRRVYFRGNFVNCPIYQRELLPLDVSIDGPAIIEEYGSTTTVFPGWKASLDSFGHLILEA